MAFSARWIAFFGLPILAGCVEPAPLTNVPAQPAASGGSTLTPDQAARAFVQVVETMEPVAERECRRRTSGVNCDFLILVDDRTDQPPNAFQTRDDDGRPIIAFTIALIADVRNSDELAFVMGHEAAHHILGHLDKQAQNAAAGAVIFAGLASLTGGANADIDSAEEIGAFLGARSFSKEFELEADRLGTVITYRSGYDVLRGAEFFARIPDPGNRFLGTHPPNAERAQTVRATLAQLEG